MFEPGDKIGDVEVVARLRAGGMAALYLGRREGAGGFSKELAIKVIHSHLASDKSFVEMFVDEARLSARIDHPNVVRVEALKEYQGAYCLLMEFVHGCSLSQLMGTLKQREMRFSPELAVAVAIRVADGLHAAHELLNPDGSPAGVVHRDVSPANVLVGYRGDVKLIDFGIAKATQRLHQTEAAGLKGKIAYMAPEQAFGREVDRRCDVYALGIVLWEMLTMRRLFKADNDLRLLDMVRDPKVAPPGAIVPGLPPALDKVILQALGRDKDTRPTSARDFRYRLLDALPAAAAVDPLQISAVVCDVMSDKIAEDREMLSLSSFNGLPHLSAQDSVTVSRLLRPVHDNVEVALDSVAHDATDLASALPAPSSRAEPPTLLPGSAPLTPASLAFEAPRRRRLVPAVLGAAAMLGVAVGGGGAFALFSGSRAAVADDALPATRADFNDPPVQEAEPEPGSEPGAAPEAAPEPAPEPVVAAPVDAPIQEVEPPLPPQSDETEEPTEIATSRRARRRRRRSPPIRVQPMGQGPAGGAAPSNGAGGRGGGATGGGGSGQAGSGQPGSGGATGSGGTTGRRGGRRGITDWEI